ncbi:MAG: CoA pyrophosphatase [Halieaceae bacterium]
MSVSLPRIEHALSHHRPRKKVLRAFFKRSAVAMILREMHGQAEILMIKRAESDGDPWSGHMAFPGGRMEPSDRHGLDVARRETEEEVGLLLGDEEPCVGRLSEIMTHPQLRRRPMVVSPYLFRLEREVEFQPNYEVAEVVWIPLEFLLDKNNRERMEWQRGRVTIPLPCYMYRGRRIWGLSLMMLDELLELLRKA